MGYIMELRKIIGTRPIIMAGACTILMNELGQILLQQRKDNGLWGLPGGSLERCESMEEVARRELYEETGLIAHKIKLLNIFSGMDLYYKYPHGDEVYNVVAAYVCRDYEGELRPEEEEVESLHFFKIEHIPADISPPDQPIIKAFISSQFIK